MVNITPKSPTFKGRMIFFGTFTAVMAAVWTVVILVILNAAGVI